jgi:hypothetical protein
MPFINASDVCSNPMTRFVGYGGVDGMCFFQGNLFEGTARVTSVTFTAYEWKGDARNRSASIVPTAGVLDMQPFESGSDYWCSAPNASSGRPDQSSYVSWTGVFRIPAPVGSFSFFGARNMRVVRGAPGGLAIAYSFADDAAASCALPVSGNPFLYNSSVLGGAVRIMVRIFSRFLPFGSGSGR